MTHFPIVALRRRLIPRQVSLGKLVPVLLSALALVTAGPAAWALTSTTTSLLTAPDNPTSGSVITLSAQVLATEYTVAGGTVSFTDTYNGVSEVLGTVQIQSTNGSAGTAVLKTEVGGVGVHQFQANYSGTSFFAASSSSAQSVDFSVPYLTAAALASTGAGPYGFTGTVSAFGPVAPTGTVTFTDTTSNFVLGSAPLNASTLQNGFTTPTNYPITGMNNGQTGGTNGPAEGDFNGDGRPDFAVPTNSGPIVILLGKGDGTFTNGTSLTPAYPFEPTAVVVGDFNQDGKQDLAVLSASGPGSIGSVNVYLGNGDGTFQTPRNFPVASTGPSASRLLATADFNNDGVADLVATNAGLNQVAILIGNGDGTFKTAVTYPTLTAPWNVVVGDINQDGNPDLVVASDGTGSVTLLLGNGDGTFQPYIGLPLGSSQVGSVALGDFNHDGWPDLAVTSAPDNQIYISLNLKTASPTFAAPVKYPMNYGPYYLTINDFNRDGNPDIISANGGDSIGVLLGNANGTFQAATYYPVGTATLFATAGDINGDDRVDITAVTATGLDVLLSGQSESAAISNINIYGCNAQSVVASYSGDGNYGSSTSAAQTFTPKTQSTTLALTVSPANNFVGQQVMLQATLTPSAYGSQTTTGEMITFKNGSTVLGTAPLVSGVAVLNLSTLPYSTSESFTASYAGDCAFTASGSNTVLGSTLFPSVLAWSTPAAITYPTPLSALQLDATDTVNGSPLAGTFTYNPALNSVLTAGTHTLSVTFVPSNSTYATQSTSVQITVNQGVPVIIWPTPTPISYGTPLNGFQLDATATSGTVPVNLAQYYNVYGIYTPGSTYPQANSFDNDGYSYSTTTLGSTVVWNGMTFNIGPANLPDAVATTGSTALTIPLPAGTFTDLFMLGAMVNNINATQTFIVTYTDNSTTTFTQNMSDWFNAAGWPGESVVNCSEKRNYENGSTQADSVCVYGYDIPLDVTKTVASITLPNTRNIVMLSMDLQTPQIPGTFVYTPPAGTIEPVGTADPLQVTFTPADTVDYTTASDTVFLTVVNPATITTPTINWPPLASITYGTPLGSTQLDAVAMAQGQPTPVVPNSQLLVVSTATDGTPFGLAGFDNAGDAYSYNELNLGSPATAGQVNYQGTTYTLGQPTVPNAITNGAVYTLAQPGNYSSVYLIGAAADITTGGGNGNATNAPFILTYADSGKPVTVTVNMSSWTRKKGTFAGETQVATTDHANTQSGGSVTGTHRLYGYQLAADPTRTLVSVTLPNNRNVVVMALGFGTNNQVVVPGSYVYTYQPGNQSAPGAILTVGTHQLNVAFTPTDTAGYNNASGTNSIVVTQATPIINWPTPEAIPAGTALSGIQLDATATYNGSTVPGNFNYTVPPSLAPANGQVLSAGIHTLQVVFTPIDTTDYATVTATVQIVVGVTGATGVGGTQGYPQAECCYFSQPTPYTVTVTGNNAAPTGTVTVTFAGQTLGSGTLVPGSGFQSSVLLSLNSFYFNPGANTVTITYSGDTNYVGNQGTASLTLLSPVFGAQTTTVGGTPTTLNLPYTFTQAGVLTYNFNPSGGGSTDFLNNGVQCYEGSTPIALTNQPLPQGTLCLFNVAFKPGLPGIRKGVVQVDFTPTGGTAEPHLFLFLSGLGAAAQISLSSAQTSVLTTALMAPQSLTFNPNDFHNANLYIANGTYANSTPNEGQVDKLSGGTLTQWIPATPATVEYPTDLTFDAFGNLVVVDSNATKVLSFSPSLAVTQIGTGSYTLSLPLAAKIDFGGNLYISDVPASGRIIVVPGETYAQYTPSLLNLGLPVNYPQALAIDNAGANLYVADAGTLNSPATTSQVVQVPLSGTGVGTVLALSPCDGTVSICSFNSPAGMAFDPNGDLYVTDSYSRVLMVPATHSNSNETTQLPITGLVNPSAIALDGSGDVYVTDLNGFVSELLVNSGVLSFKTANSSLTTTITNTGNLPLQNITVTAPTSPFTVTTDGCSGKTVPAGGKCSLTYQYSTSASQVTSTVTITSNAFSANGVSITLKNY